MDKVNKLVTVFFERDVLRKGELSGRVPLFFYLTKNDFIGCFRINDLSSGNTKLFHFPRQIT